MKRMVMSLLCFMALVISAYANTLTLIATISPTGTTATFSSIPASFTNLLIIGSVRGDQAAVAVGLSLTFNNDGGSNYETTRVGTTDGAANTASSTSGNAFINVATFPGSTAAANYSAAIMILIPNYVGTTFNKIAMGYFGSPITVFQRLNMGAWNNTVAVNRIDLVAGTGNFVAGTVFSLYGMN